VFYNREKRGNDNETGLVEGRVIEMSTTVLSIYAMKEGGGIEMSTTVLSILRDARSPSFALNTYVRSVFWHFISTTFI
jgi:hypothetical protein